MPAQRTKQYLLTLTPEEHEGIKNESAKLGISMADFIRLLYKQWIDGLRFEWDKNIAHKIPEEHNGNLQDK